MAWTTPLTLANFRIRYPEFEGASDTLVNSALDDAMKEVSEQAFGTASQQAGFVYAAMVLAISPFGQQARLSAKDGESTYSVRWTKLSRAWLGGPRVL